MPKKPIFIASTDDQILVKPLTPREAQWCQDLAALLARAPSRLSLVTGGDANLDVIDERAWNAREPRAELADGGARRAGLVLGTVVSRCKIHGVSI
jgi:hypothetical protein